MLITQLKNKEEIIPYIKEKVLLISCSGCREVYFPIKEMEELKSELKKGGLVISDELIFDYICNEDWTRKRFEIYKDKINEVNTILVFSCGVGIQTVASLLPEKIIISGSDTFYLPGFSGITPLEYDCEQCSECMLGYTLGICPITACSKGLLNGPCGGAKNGKCEVSKDMECGWQRILDKSKNLNEKIKITEKIRLRNYSKLT
ncbi:MAG: methylenetetrahydrofolate reductase C-terminal domain-containing protein [Candidatus Firestonebacteria bacterium]